MTVFGLVLEFIANANTCHSLPAIEYGRLLSSLILDVESWGRLNELLRHIRKVAARQQGYRKYFNAFPSSVIERLSLPVIGETPNREKILLLHESLSKASTEASVFIWDFAPNPLLAEWYLRGDFQSTISCIAAFTMLQQYTNSGESEIVLAILRGELRQALLALRSDALYNPTMPPEDCREEETLFWCRTWVTRMAIRLREAGMG
jgi:hypothetical protein